VGKSTLTVHLAYSAIEAGLRVLLVDMDKQASLSLTFEPSKNAPPGLKASRYELAGVVDLMQTIHVIRTQGFNPRLRHVGILPMKTNTRSVNAKQALDALRKRYGEAILPEVLPEREAVRQAIANRRPVWIKVNGEGHLKAAQEWQAACNSILGRI